MKKWNTLLFTKLQLVKVRRLCSSFLSRRLMRATTALALLSLFAFAQAGQAQTTPLKFENNYFVAGDYVVGGWANKRISPSRPGYATGTISIPDTVQANALTVPQAGVPTQVPAGADVVAAFLYWTTVETQSALDGQNAFFRGYAIQGTVLGNPNAPVSWSSGGCSGDSQGSKTMRAYRADVRPFLPVDSNGIIQPNASYAVELRDSGSNGNTAPFTLGATLVIIYRVLSTDFPLTAIVLYDGAFAPSNTSNTFTQMLQGFYQPGFNPPFTGVLAKITHIAANGQLNKSETVSVNGVTLSSLYGNKPPFPGLYNGAWDNPTWNVSAALNLPPNDPSQTTSVVPASNNSGCVSWGGIIFSTTVKDSDFDGLLDYWEQLPPNPVNPYTAGSAQNPAGNPGYVDVGSGKFVALPGANPAQRDIFLQLDYMCSGSVVTNPDYSSTCNTSGGGTSFSPPAAVLTMMTNAFSAKGINLHLDVRNAIPEQTCTDDFSTSPPTLCMYPNQPGVVGWKDGFVFLKNQPLNYPDENSCAAATDCVRRFQPGKKDSYHNTIFAHALGVANWDLSSGTLTNVVASGTTVTFTTSTPHGLLVDANAGNGRVIISDAISNPNLSGLYFVQSVPNPTTFTIQIATATNATLTTTTDPNLSVAVGLAGTVSGFSDVGGADSLVSLGNWGADGLAVNVQAGTFMHELGHTLALSHGGYYFDTPGSYIPTVEANCKANFQSVMSYLFQFDLLDGVLDYSEQNLNLLNENSLSGVPGLSPAPFYPTTKWYSLTPPGGVGTAATRHCDGSPKSPLTDAQPTMYRVEGLANPVSPAWSSPQDINFDGTLSASMRGYNDWANLDPRQIGATGSLSAGGGLKIGGGGGLKIGGGGGLKIGGGGGLKIGGGGGLKIGGGGGLKIGGGGIGNNESTYEAASSVSRPPRNLMVTPSDHPFPPIPLHAASFSWNQPTFGQVSYSVYRGVGGGAFSLLASPVATTSYTDSAVSDCTTYTYGVSSVLNVNGNESVPSNSVKYSVPCPPAALTAALTVANGVGSTNLNWSAASTASGAIDQNKIYRDDGSGIQLLNTVNSATTTYTDQQIVNHKTYTYYVTAASAILNDMNGCPAGQFCRESSTVSTTISVNWMVDSSTTITSIVPGPSSILGQSLTVSVTVSPAVGAPPPTPTGTVTVSDSAKTICTITLSGGSGNCTGTPSILIGGLAAVGTRTITATYSGDATFNGSAGAKNQPVFYGFNGFLSPLNLGSYSGSFNLGKTIPVKWQLKTFSGTFITDSNVVNHATLALTVYFNGPAVNGACPGPSASASFKLLFSPQSGAAGGTTFRYDTTNNQFIFNWDTSKANFGMGCYTLSLQLNDGSAVMTTWLQAK